MSVLSCRWFNNHCWLYTRERHTKIHRLTKKSYMHILMRVLQAWLMVYTLAVFLILLSLILQNWSWFFTSIFWCLCVFCRYSSDSRVGCCRFTAVCSEENDTVCIGKLSAECRVLTILGLPLCVINGNFYLILLVSVAFCQCRIISKSLTYEWDYRGFLR